MALPEFRRWSILLTSPKKLTRFCGRCRAVRTNGAGTFILMMSSRWQSARRRFQGHAQDERGDPGHFEVESPSWVKCYAPWRQSSDDFDRSEAVRVCEVHRLCRGPQSG